MQDVRRDDLLWLAGLLEGEGSFMAGPPSSPGSPLISVQMTDQDVINRVSAIFGTKTVFNKVRNVNWKDTWVAKLHGGRAVELMQQLRPYMGLRRAGQIDRAIASYSGGRKRKLCSSDIDAIHKRLDAGETVTVIAVDYPQVCRRTINYIKSKYLASGALM